MPLTNPETEQAPHKVPSLTTCSRKRMLRADASEVCNLPLLPTVRVIHTKTLQSSTQVAVADASRVQNSGIAVRIARINAKNSSCIRSETTRAYYEQIHRDRRRATAHIATASHTKATPPPPCADRGGTGAFHRAPQVRSKQANPPMGHFTGRTRGARGYTYRPRRGPGRGGRGGGSRRCWSGRAWRASSRRRSGS